MAANILMTILRIAEMTVKFRGSFIGREIGGGGGAGGVEDHLQLYKSNIIPFPRSFFFN